MTQPAEMIVPPQPVTPPKPVEFWTSVGSPAQVGLLVAWRCQAPASGVGPPQWDGLVLTGTWWGEQWSTTTKWVWAAYLRPWRGETPG